MSITRIPILTSLFPTASNAGIPIYSMGSKNCIFTEYPDGRKVATQRYPINIYDFSGAGGNTAGEVGRGVYFWNFSISGVNDERTFYVNNDQIYEEDYTNSVATITAGRDPVHFLELNDYLIILDPQNNEMWYSQKSTPTTFTKMTTVIDPDWPFTATNKMAGGGAVLNGTLYIMDMDGNIWNSALNDPTSWSGIDFIEASRSTDSGIFLTSHHDQLVAISSKTIEFFYDAGNPVGSPLERRQDIFYNTGCFDRKRVFDTGDTIFFLGAERAGTIRAYILSNFQLDTVSDDSVDIFINNTISRSASDFLVSGAIVAERTLFFVSALLPVSTTSWLGQSTIVYDATKEYWTTFETGAMTTAPTTLSFPVISNSERGIGLNESLIMLTNGDVFRFDLASGIQDTVGYLGDYFEDDDYIEYQDDYILDLSTSSMYPIEFIVYTPEYDGVMDRVNGTYTNKFQNRMTLVGTTTKGSSNSTPIKISWTDDNYSSFSEERNLDTANRRSLTRGGNFKRRAYKVRYVGIDKLLVEGIELDFRASGYA